MNQCRADYCLKFFKIKTPNLAIFSTDKIPRILNHKMVQGGDLISSFWLNTCFGQGNWFLFNHAHSAIPLLFLKVDKRFERVILYLVFCPKMCPRTFLLCFDLNSLLTLPKWIRYKTPPWVQLEERFLFSSVARISNPIFQNENSWIQTSVQWQFSGLSFETWEIRYNFWAKDRDFQTNIFSWLLSSLSTWRFL